MEERQTITTSRITVEQAKKSISEMNLINGFLFDSALENEDEAKIVVGNILKAVFNRKLNISSVVSQKPIQAIDTRYHGIRLDVKTIEATVEGVKSTVTIYDTEMEDRESDRRYLPKRMRYYVAMNDSKFLEAGEDYDKLPDYISVVILSYDPFLAGDMYYEVKSNLITHPDLEYNNGIRNIFLYCNGKPNFDKPNSSIKLSQSHSKKLQEMLKYIVSGEKPASSNEDIEEIDTIVTKVKGRTEVTAEYMRQWDRELSIKRETKQKAALDVIIFNRQNNISDDKTRLFLKKSFELQDDIIDELFRQAGDA